MRIAYLRLYQSVISSPFYSCRIRSKYRIIYILSCTSSAVLFVHPHTVPSSFSPERRKLFIELSPEHNKREIRVLRTMALKPINGCLHGAIKVIAIYNTVVSSCRPSTWISYTAARAEERLVSFLTRISPPPTNTY